MAKLVDISSAYNFSKGKLRSVDGIVFHHTAGRGGIDGVLRTFKQRGYPAQYVIDRNGTIFKVIPDGDRGSQIRPNSKMKLNNRNTIGVEVIGMNDKDISPDQVASAKQLYKSLAVKFPTLTPDKVYWHGLVNPGHKMADEGYTIAASIRRDAGVPIPPLPKGGMATTPDPFGVSKFQQDKLKPSTKTGVLSDEAKTPDQVDSISMASPSIDGFDPTMDAIGGSLADQLGLDQTDPNADPGAGQDFSSIFTPPADPQDIPLIDNPDQIDYQNPFQEDIGLGDVPTTFRKRLLGIGDGS